MEGGEMARWRDGEVGGGWACGKKMGGIVGWCDGEMGILFWLGRYIAIVAEEEYLECILWAQPWQWKEIPVTTKERDHSKI